MTDFTCLFQWQGVKISNFFLWLYTGFLLSTLQLYAWVSRKAYVWRFGKCVVDSYWVGCWLLPRVCLSDIFVGGYFAAVCWKFSYCRREISSAKMETEEVITGNWDILEQYQQVTGLPLSFEDHSGLRGIHDVILWFWSDEPYNQYGCAQISESRDIFFIEVFNPSFWFTMSSLQLVLSIFMIYATIVQSLLISSEQICSWFSELFEFVNRTIDFQYLNTVLLNHWHMLVIRQNSAGHVKLQRF